MNRNELDEVKGVFSPIVVGLITGALLMLWMIFTGMCLSFFDLHPQENLSLLFIAGIVTWLTVTITGLRIVSRSLLAEKGATYKWRAPLGLLLYVALWMFSVHALLISFPPLIEALPFLTKGEPWSGLFVLVLLVVSVFLLKYCIKWMHNRYEILQPREVVNN